MLIPEMEKTVADLNSRCKACRERATKLKIEIDRLMAEYRSVSEEAFRCETAVNAILGRPLNPPYFGGLGDVRPPFGYGPQAYPTSGMPYAQPGMPGSNGVTAPIGMGAPMPGVGIPPAVKFNMERDRQAEFAAWQRELSERMKQTDGSNSCDTNSNVDVERVEEYGDK